MLSLCTVMPLCKDVSGQGEKSMGPSSRQSTPGTSGHPGPTVLPAGHGQPGRMQRRAARFTRLPLCGPILLTTSPCPPLSWISHFRCMKMRGLYGFGALLRKATAQVSCLPLSMHAGPQTHRLLLVYKGVFRNFFLTRLRMFL